MPKTVYETEYVGSNPIEWDRSVSLSIKIKEKKPPVLGIVFLRWEYWSIGVWGNGGSPE